MKSGDLTSALRASLSAPGVFSPVERDGRLLVDGGLAENLPIDVARQMGVDVLIVVDVGFPLLDRSKLNSAPVISNQMLAILMRRDAERQRATLTAKDIIIDPALADASSFDFGIVSRAVARGADAARAAETEAGCAGGEPGGIFGLHRASRRCSPRSSDSGFRARRARQRALHRSAHHVVQGCGWQTCRPGRN